MAACVQVCEVLGRRHSRTGSDGLVARALERNPSWPVIGTMFSRSLFAALLFITALRAATAAAHDAPFVDGRLSIRGGSEASPIVITVTERLAGAIDSLRWNGKEFIDSFDHGRQLQSAASFDAGAPGPFWAERYNPTEAGSRRDGIGPKSSSRLLSVRAAGAEISTVTQPAFWLAPGEESSGRPALNTQVLSEHRIAKRVRIGYRDLRNVIEYDVTFTIPAGERHRFAQFEAVTGYMPAEFEKFHKLDIATGTLSLLDDGPGEQSAPVVFSTADDAYAMGVYSPDQPSKGFEEAGYGRFRFAQEKVTKWNCVFRVRNEGGVAAGDYRYRMFLAVGTKDAVRSALTAVARSTSNPKP